MKKKIIPFLVGIITMTAAVGGVSVLIGATLYAPDGRLPEVHAAVGANKNPARLLIPSLGINAAVQRVGLNSQGNIGAPDNFTDVAWFVRSAAPGTVGGVSVIDGHVDNGLGLAGVFIHLNTIRPGAAVNVVTKGGKTVYFKVTNVTAYNYERVPMEKLLQTSGSSTIRLITCDGTWVSDQKTYNKRLVVTAVET